jgi:hypothetical protein
MQGLLIVDLNRCRRISVLMLASISEPRKDGMAGSQDPEARRLRRLLPMQSSSVYGFKAAHWLFNITLIRAVVNGDQVRQARTRPDRTLQQSTTT